MPKDNAQSPPRLQVKLTVTKQETVFQTVSLEGTFVGPQGPRSPGSESARNARPAVEPLGAETALGLKENIVNLTRKKQWPT